MGRIFRYEINPLYLKAVLEKMTTPDPEEAWEHFIKIHQSPKKIWRPQIKLPTIQISKIYLNGIIVSLFTLLFLYLVFFRGYSGMSEKKNEGLIKKISAPAKNDNSDNQINKKHDGQLKEGSGLIIENKSADTIRQTTVSAVTPKDTFPNNAVNSTERFNNKVIPESVENKNSQKNSQMGQFIENDTLRNNDINPFSKKKKKRKKANKEEAEILPSVGPEKITIPLGTSNEEDVKLRGE
jgi:hypothetical protein